MAVGPQFHRRVLPSGLTVVLEHHPRVRSASLGLWVRVGSRGEAPDQAGMSHFVEHMLFKGTETRSAFDIAVSLERVGGDLNAFTDKEYTCYHATVLGEHVPRALDVLGELVTRPAFPAAEVEREKHVLLQELASVEESPDDRILDLLLQNVWKGEPLGSPVIGRRATIRAATRAGLLKYFRTHYTPSNMVLSVAGAVDMDTLCEVAECSFRFPARGGEGKRKVASPPKYRSRRLHRAADTDQLHLLAGYQGTGFRDPGRFDALVLSIYLGGGMGSRLFQEIREKAGLAYAVDSETVTFTDAGLFTFYLATRPRSLGRCLKILEMELKRLTEAPPEREALEGTKGQIKGAVLMAADEMDSRQESIGRNELVFGKYFSVEDIVREIDRVTPESVHAVAQRIFRPEAESVVTLSRGAPKRPALILS